MKQNFKKQLLMILMLFTLSLSSQNNWLTTGNTPTAPTAFGTNAATVPSLNANINFVRQGIFAGHIQQYDLSLGFNSFNNSANSNKGTVAIGPFAGQFNNNTNTFNDPQGKANTYIGSLAGRGVPGTISNGFNNVCVGKESGLNITSGEGNTFIGSRSGLLNQTGSYNLFLGFAAGQNSLNTTSNIFIGDRSGYGLVNASSLNLSSNNIFIGNISGFSGLPNSQNSGKLNTYIGYACGSSMISGSFNTFFGKVVLPSLVSSSTIGGNNTSNTIIIADGGNNGSGTLDSGNQRLYIHSNGNAGFDIGNNNIPQNRLEINSTDAVANTLGLRFRNAPTIAITNPTSKILSVNAQGDVILVEDKLAAGGTLTALTCSNPVNFVTKFSAVNNEITCSQIFDNGTSVGIGTTGPFTYNSSTDINNGQLGGSFNGVLKLDVTGAARFTNIYASSDKKFKKDIKTIDKSLEKILALEGKTYNWRKDEFKDKNFGSELQFGLIAQEVQKVLPTLVIESEKGDLAINYIGLIPVLIEAMKEQQIQINELKSQLSDSFKAQNQDLLQFTNTKIISVSPNPSSDVISVSLNIDKAVTTANLQVHDINGVLLNNLNLTERNTNIIKMLHKDNIGNGIFIINLVINGKSIDTKKIIFE